MPRLSDSVDTLKTLKKPQKEALQRLGITTVRDLLLHVPTRYEHAPSPTTINRVEIGQAATLTGTITHIQTVRTRRGLLITQAALQDQTGTIRLTWFGQPFIKKLFPVGASIRVSGTVRYGRNGLSIQSPTYKKPEDTHSATPFAVPIYRASKGISPLTIQRLVERLLPLCASFHDPLPAVVRTRESLLPFSRMLQWLHAPQTQQQLDQARQRQSFSTVWDIQWRLFQRRQATVHLTAPALAIHNKAHQRFLEALPFAPTNAQSRVLTEVRHALSQQHPMKRLLQGDVGSGKTVIAAYALWAAASAGYQAALMAPTELLARQHAQKLTELLRPLQINVALLTGSLRTQERKEVLYRLSSGEPMAVVGTHALIQKRVVLPRLAVAIIDEQHRFGVEQREALQRERPTGHPHTLSLTATPIPRTLAMAVYADVSVSTLDELPPGRTPITTKLVGATGQTRAEQFIEQQLNKGHQAFFVCPRIEQSDDTASAIDLYERLSSGIFRAHPLGLLHSKIPSAEQHSVMEAFTSGALRGLVATTMVEVGVDIPNATVMAIYHADAFGLAQLHQLRGRVGRGSATSYCFAFTTRRVPAKRLHLFASTTDGFALAQHDLEERGPGELLGVRQSGLADTHMEALSDLVLVGRVQRAMQAYAALERDTANDTAERAADALPASDKAVSAPRNVVTS